MKYQVLYNNAKLFIFPVITAIAILFRMILIIKIGGVELFGLLGYIISIITICTIIIQFYSNQVIIVKLINSDVANKHQFLYTIFFLGIIVTLIWTIIIICFGQYFSLLNSLIEYSIWSKGVILAIFLSFLVSIFDLLSLSNEKIYLYYSSISFGTLCSLIFSYIILKNFNHDYIIFIPALTSFSTLIYYLTTIRVKHNVLSHLVNYLQIPKYLFFKKLLINSWHINIIPLNSSIFDYILRSAFLKLSGATTLGYFQTIVSIESMTGNIFLGTYYKKELIRFSTNIKAELSDIKRSILGSIFISLIPTFGFLLLIVINNVIKINIGLFEVVTPLIILSIIKISWNTWGVIGQILITRQNHRFVTLIEILIKILTTGIAIIFLLFSNIEIWSYVVSAGVVSIFLLYINHNILKSRFKNVSLFEINNCNQNKNNRNALINNN